MTGYQKLKKKTERMEAALKEILRIALQNEVREKALEGLNDAKDN